MAESLQNLERWVGSFPGEHEYSELAGLEPDTTNPELSVFFDSAKNLIENWQGNKFVGLYLYGSPGTGKTHAAIGLGRALHESGAEVFYKHVSQVRHWNNPDAWVGRRYGSDLHYDGNGIFATEYSIGAKRNPRVALIMDDYRPEAHIPLHNAVEAAAQFGGLVIVTSNYTDPFKLVEIPEPVIDEEKLLITSFLERENPEAVKNLQNRRKDTAKAISDSLRSRIAAGFKLIEFTGEDRRTRQSFWS